MRTQIQRIPELDGLRALAVALVVAYHFDLPVPGGFVGVDLFFAVSGFVITRQLLGTTGSLHDATFPRISAAFQDFYRRRALRLLPNALTLCATVVTLSALRPSLFGNLTRNVKNALFGLTGLGNWYAIRYPDIALREVRPLIHMWSLSIEEQFYVALPVVMLLGRRHAKSVAAVFGAAAVLVSIWAATTSQTPSAAFFSTWARVAPIGFGVILAVAISNDAARDRLRDWRGHAPLLLMLLTALGGFSLVMRWDSAALRSGGFIATAVICAGIVALSAVGVPSRVGTVLRSTPLQLLGERSYALYLWHFPVAYLFMGLSRMPQMLLRLMLAAVLTEISFRAIERPWRHTTRVARAYIAPAVLGVLALALVVTESRANA